LYEKFDAGSIAKKEMMKEIDFEFNAERRMKVLSYRLK
jgi:hypothetical protein